jgi:hypothetical protein
MPNYASHQGAPKAPLNALEALSSEVHESWKRNCWGRIRFSRSPGTDSLFPTLRRARVH